MPELDQFPALRADQCRRWQQGERVRVEAYLEQAPELRADPEALLDLIYNEMVLREEHADPPRLEEYVARFPQFEAQLRIQFEVHWALESASLASADLEPEAESAAGHDPRPCDCALGGATVAGYEIVEELGRGGMGVVYRAVQRDLKRPVALKMILAGAHAGPQERARFWTEAEAAARLQHPNIVQIHQVGEQDGCLYLVLELVDGVRLDESCAGRPVPPRAAAGLVKTLARAAHYAHQRGVIHRDLKPANVLLQVSDLRFQIADLKGGARRGSPDSADLADFKSAIANLQSAIPKITDFGLAKLLDGEGQHTPANAFLGTPCYMAPEQAVGRAQAIGPATDVYALGAILYELLTGAAPFQGETPVATLEMVRGHDPVPPRLTQPGVPRDLETICLKCLEKEPARRYPSAGDLADDLDRFLADVPIHARPATVAGRLLKWVHRRRTLATLLLVGSLGLVVLAAILGWHVYDRRVTAERSRDQEQRALAEARAHCQTFLGRRDEILFHGLYGTLFADADAARTLHATEEEAREALTLVGVTVEDGGPPQLYPGLGDAERAEVRAGCYQILVVLADVVAEGAPQPGVKDPPARRALAILDRAADLVPATPAYHLRRARYLRRLGDEAGARAERSRADGLRPAGALDYFLLGQEYYHQGQLADACAEFKSALVLRRDDFWSQFFLGLSRLKQGSQADLADAAACLTRCAESRPGFIWTYLVRARTYKQMGKLDAAEADYRRAEALKPNVDACYLLYLHRGQLRLHQGTFPAATTDFARAVALLPNRYDAHLDWARACAKRGEAAAARRHLRQAVTLGAPAAVLADYHAELARERYGTGQYPAALEACARALQAHPGYAAVHALRGRILLQLRRYEEAAQAFDRYLSYGGQPVADVFKERGLARMKLGDYLGAKDDYGRALDRQPDAELFLHRGWAYYFADSWQPALHDFEEAIQRDRANGDAYVGRGLSRVQLGRPRDAVADAEEALRRGPKTPEMMHNIACTFALAADRVGRNADGVAYRRQAVDAVQKTLDLVPAAERPAFWRDRIVPDKALDPIRDTSTFRRLVQEYGGVPP